MNRLFLTAIFLFIFTSFMNLNAQWLKIYGGSSSDRVSSIQQTNDGGYIVAGTREHIDLPNCSDILILKLTSEGDIEWQKTYGSEYGRESAYSIQQTNDGGYIVAGTFGKEKRWVLKLTSVGDIEWQKTYGDAWEDTYSVQQTNDGGYIIAGETPSYGAHGYWESDIWIFKLTSEGDVEWQKTYGGGDGKRQMAYSIQQTNDGGYIVAGYTYFPRIPKIDIWIFKLTSEGYVEWQKTYGGGDDSEKAYSIQQTNDGGYIVAGTREHIDLSNSSDILILKLTSEGDIEWQKTYGSEYGRESAYSIQQTNDGGYIVAGNICSGTQMMGYEDFWILKLLPYGNIDSKCRFIKKSKIEVSNTNISPEDTDIESKDTDIAPQYIDISPQDTNAYVYNLCSEKPLLLIGGDGTGSGGTDPAFGTYIYELGTEVRIKAIPAFMWYFREWTGDVPLGHEYDNPIIITMDGDKFIVAHFQSTTPPYRDKGEEDGDGARCFIATAAYGSPLHPYVETLRDFRDKYLLSNEFGRELVRLYYKYSPYVANIIVKYKVLKVAVRTNLIPLIAFSYSMVHFGPIITGVILIFIFMLPFFLVTFHRRKLRKVR